MAEFVYITDDTYTKKQVLRMEHLVLTVLSFDLAAPTINQFLTQYFLHQPVSSKVESLSMVSVSCSSVVAFPIYRMKHLFLFFLQFLGELSLIDCDPILKYLPSQTAAAAFILANHSIAGGSWVSLHNQLGQKLGCWRLCKH